MDSSNSLAGWVRQACIDLGKAAPRVQVLLTSEERAELNRLRKENRDLRMAAAHFAKDQLLPRGFA